MSDFRIIFTRPDDGGLSIIVPAPGVSEAEAAKAVPPGLVYEVVQAADIPSDRTFRDAWCPCAVNKVRVDVDKAKGIAHEKRRAARAAEFAPLDAIIAKQIPGADAQAVEEQRQAIRDKYAAMQVQIDMAQTPDEIKAALGSN